MRKHISNRRGSTLGWVLIVMMMLILLVTMAVMLVSTYNIRSIKSNSKQQSYLTARSVAQAIAQDFTSGSQKESVIRNAITDALIAGDNKEKIESGKRVLIGSNEDPITINFNSIIDKAIDYSMGECNVMVDYDPVTRIMIITVNADKNGQTDSISVKLKNEPSAKVKNIYDGIKVADFNSPNLLSAIQNGPYNVWITGDSGCDLSEDGEMIKGDYPGTIYSKGDVTQSEAVIGKMGSTVMGSVISDGDIILDDEANSFNLESTDALYSLYSMKTINLTGSINIDNDTDSDLKIMKSDVISLLGNDKNDSINIYNDIESGTETSVSGNVSIYGNMTSAGDLNISTLDVGPDAGIKIGTEKKPVEINAETITIEAETSPITICGDITAVQSIVLSGDITINGDIKAPSVVMSYSDKSAEGGQVLINGRVFATDNVRIDGDYAQAEAAKKYITVSSEIYLYNGGKAYDELEPFKADAPIFVKKLWTDAPEVDETYIYKDSPDDTDSRYGEWNNSDKNLRAASAILENIEKKQDIKVILSSEMPREDDLDISAFTGEYGEEKTSDNSIELLANGNYVFTIIQGTEETQGPWTVNIDPASSDTYYIIGEENPIHIYNGNAGKKGAHNSYVISDNSEFTVAMTEDEISGETEGGTFSGYMLGNGQLTIDDGGSFCGIINMTGLSIGKNVEITYVSQNPDDENIFSGNWKLIQYAR